MSLFMTAVNVDTGGPGGGGNLAMPPSSHTQLTIWSHYSSK